MTTEWLSGGFIIALAAVLWLVYLVPSWFRSRQYLATERNAVRLQQTLRILAETAEVPDEVRVEASARSIAEQERILKHRAAEREIDSVPAAVRAADRLRRSRAVTALVLVLALAVAVLGGVQTAANGTWLLLAAGVGVAFVSLLVLSRLAKAGRRLRLPLPEEFAAQAGARAGAHRTATGTVLAAVPVFDAVDSLDAESVGAATDDPAVASSSAEAGWVPVAMPRPLYLSRAALAPFSAVDASDAADVADSGTVNASAGPELEAEASAGLVEAPDHETLLRRAAAEAEEALRERLRTELETVAELPSAPAQASAPAAPSRFARMGIVDPDSSTSLDLDEVLARRRAV